MDGPYGGIVEFLALTGQRREEVAQLAWDESTSPAASGHCQPHAQRMAPAHRVPIEGGSCCTDAIPKIGEFVSRSRARSPFKASARRSANSTKLCSVSGWRLHDLRRTCVSGMARLGVAPHVADKILNHQTGTIWRCGGLSAA